MGIISRIAESHVVGWVLTDCVRICTDDYWTEGQNSKNIIVHVKISTY